MEDINPYIRCYSCLSMQRKILKTLLFTTLLLLACSKIPAQYYTTGNDPFGLRWRQIKTPHVRLVFEKNMYEQAARLAAFIDSVAPRVAWSLDHNPLRIDLLLHNQTAVANGMVTWAPKRSEFFTIPRQDLTSTDWLSHLAIHEYRHVVQIDKLNQGFTRGLNYVFGQQATGAVIGLYLPMWLLEGDAVVAETALTASGRGRSFSFTNELKAQLLERGIYSYDKAYLGSNRDYVPNHYNMGYLMTAKARALYGTDIWDNTFEYVGRNSWNPLAFNTALRRSTGLNQKQLYKKIFSQMSEQWAEEAANLHESDRQPINVPEDDYLLYSSPIAINDSTLIAELTGPGVRSAIVSIDTRNGKKKTLLHTGPRQNEPISANSVLVAWSELKRHPRWEHKVWSVIRTSNVNGKRSRYITRRGYLSSPALHPTEDLIAAVKSNTVNSYSIVLLDARIGKTLKEFPTPDNYYPIHPSWNSNGENLVMVLLSAKGRALFTLQPESGEWTQLSSWTYDEIKNPHQQGNLIWYSAQGDLSDEIFVFDAVTKENKRLTSSKFGAYHPTITPDGRLIYTDYRASGLRPVIHTDNSLYPAPNPALSVSGNLATLISRQEEGFFAANGKRAHNDEFPQEEEAPWTMEPVDSNTTDTSYLALEDLKEKYPEKRYSKFNLINIHSWAPALVDFDEGKVQPGITLLSQNLHGTSLLMGGYNANPSYAHEKYYIDFSFRAFYPIINLSWRFGDKDFKDERYYQPEPSEDYMYHYNIDMPLWYHSLKAGIKVPFNFSRGAWNRYLEGGVQFTYNSMQGFTFLLDEYRLMGKVLVPTGTTMTATVDKQERYGLEYVLGVQNIRRGTSRDASNRMGQTLSLFYRHSPWGNDDPGSIKGYHSRLYLPGIGRFHSISIISAYQKKEWGQIMGESADHFLMFYQYNDVISYPRGYNNVENKEMSLVQLNYTLPLWNPDLSLGSFAYIKRLNLTAFYDRAWATDYLFSGITEEVAQFDYSPWSSGIELLSETHLFRIYYPVQIGTRTSYRSVDDKITMELLLRTTISIGN